MAYRDDHGHFVSKQEDGGKCTHDFETGFRSVFEERGIKAKPKEDWKTTKMASGILYEKDGVRYMYNDDDIPQLDKSTFKSNFEQAIKVGNYEKVKAIYDRQVQDKGVDSPEAKGTKLALDEMSKNFDRGENHIDDEDEEYERNKKTVQRFHI